MRRILWAALFAAACVGLSGSALAAHAPPKPRILVGGRRAPGERMAATVVKSGLLIALTSPKNQYQALEAPEGLAYLEVILRLRNVGRRPVALARLTGVVDSANAGSFSEDTTVLGQLNGVTSATLRPGRERVWRIAYLVTRTIKRPQLALSLGGGAKVTYVLQTR
jgi:hypothetical protein